MDNKKEDIPRNLQGKIAYVLMKAGVHPDDIDTCIQWAFGKDAWYVPIYPDWPNRWKILHPTYPTIKKGESFIEIMYVVGLLFVNWQYEQHQKLQLN